MAGILPGFSPEGAYGDGLLEVKTRFGGTATMRPPGIADSLEQAVHVNAAYAHLRQELAVLLRKARMIEVLQTTDFRVRSAKA